MLLRELSVIKKIVVVNLGPKVESVDVAEFLVYHGDAEVRYLDGQWCSVECHSDYVAFLVWVG